MPHNTLLRLLDTFFRRWWLYLLPVVLLFGVGVVTASSADTEYRSIGSMNVASDTLLQTLTQSQVNYGYRTPAEATSGSVNELLQTGEFVKSVAAAAGLTTAYESGAVTFDTIRESLNVYAAGESLVIVAASFDNPEVAYRLASGTIEAFRQHLVDYSNSDSQTAIDFFQQQVTAAQEQVDTAQANLSSYLAEHLPQLNGVYSATDQVQIDQLTATLTTAQTRLDGYQTSLDSANLQMQQSTASVNQRFQVVDEPEQPVSREPRLKKMVLSVAMFTAIGALLALGALALATLLDRTVRFPADVQHYLELPVLATVPRVRRSRSGAG